MYDCMIEVTFNQYNRGYKQYSRYLTRSTKLFK